MENPHIRRDQPTETKDEERRREDEEINPRRDEGLRELEWRGEEE